MSLSLLGVPLKRRSRSRSRSPSASKDGVNGASNNNRSSAEGYLLALQEKLLSDCADFTTEEDWNKATVLDVGCGWGETTYQFAKKMPSLRSVLGIDHDPDAIDYAFAIYADERLDFAHVDIEDMDTFDLKWGGRFDWLFSMHALLWTKEQSVALRNLMWCLRPGGKCFIAIPAGKPPDVHAAIAKVITESKWAKYFKSIPEVVADMTDENYNRLWFHHPHADRVYSALLEQVGYQVLRTKQVEFKYAFPGHEEYLECLKFLLQKPIQQVPADKRNAFIKDIVKQATKKAKKEDGKITWCINYAAVIAKRPEL